MVNTQFPLTYFVQNQVYNNLCFNYFVLIAEFKPSEQLQENCKGLRQKQGKHAKIVNNILTECQLLMKQYTMYNGYNINNAEGIYELQIFMYAKFRNALVYMSLHAVYRLSTLFSMSQ